MGVPFKARFLDGQMVTIRVSSFWIFSLTEFLPLDPKELPAPLRSPAPSGWLTYWEYVLIAHVRSGDQ